MSNNHHDIRPKTKEERAVLLKEQFDIWVQKLYDETFTKKDQYPGNLTYLVQYADACRQYIVKVQKNLRDEDEEVTKA